MIDIAEIHRESNSKKILAQFFYTSSYYKAYDYLLSKGLKDKEISQRFQAYRGVAGVANVHPFIYAEYLRWADYKKYADILCNSVEKIKP